MQKLKTYFLFVSFLICLILPTINSIFGIWKFERPDENRKYKDQISLKVDRFSQEFDAYFNDNFSFRSPLLDVFHQLKFKVFKVSTYANKTIIGEHDWYFLGEKQLSIYQGHHDFNEKELNAFLDEWTNRKKYLDEKNIPFYWIIAPNKHNLYPEFLPKHLINIRSRNRTGLLLDHLNPSLSKHIIDPLPTLLKAKEDHKVYYQLDNHWNFRAGEVVSKQLYERILKDHSQLKLNQVPEYKFDTIKANWGIHYRTLGIPELYELITVPKFKQKPIGRYKIQIPETFALKDDYALVYENPKGVSDLKVLIIRDSFGEQTIPFLSGLFKESIFIFDSWQLDLNKDYIERFNPDLVIYLGLESHIENIIK